MYAWTPEGIENLRRQAKDYGQAAAQAGTKTFEEAFLHRLNFYASRSEAAVGKLLSEIIEHADPFWPPLPPKRDVPEVEEPTRREVARKAGAPPPEPDRDDYRSYVPEPGFLSRLLGGEKRHQERVKQAEASDEAKFREAEKRYEQELARWEEAMASTREAILERQKAARREAEEYNREIQEATDLRADPTPDFLSKVVSNSLLRTFYATMSNLSLPLPGPETVRSEFDPDAKRVVVGLALPPPQIVVPPAGFTLNGETPIPEPRSAGDRNGLYRTYAAALVLGSAHVIRELIEEGGLEGILEEAVVNAEVGNGEREDPAPDRRWVASLRIPSEEVHQIQGFRDDPPTGVTSLEGRLAEAPVDGDGITPYRPS